MKNQKNTNKGITLIALVITIIVLLILAGVALASLFGENGILNNAETAKNQTNLANSEEQVALAVQSAMTYQNSLGTVKKENLEAELDKLLGAGEENYTIEPDDETGPWTVTVTKTGYTIKISSTGKTEEINSGDQTTTAVTIETLMTSASTKNETDGNEFVWIPVGLGKFIEISKNFERTTIGDTVYSSADTYENGKSYDLQEWITTTLDNGGYYIGRFEASNNGSDQAVMLSASDRSWTNITQPNATIQAQAIYSAETGTNKDLYYSDLVNSYAWDTLVSFLEQYSDNIDNTDGTGGGKTYVCNVFDVHGKASEWSTETVIGNSDGCCTARGTYINLYHLSTDGSATSRYVRNITTADEDDYSNWIYHDFGFRVVLCVK